MKKLQDIQRVGKDRSEQKRNTVLTVFIAGLVIIGLINLLNVYIKGKEAAEKITYTNYEEFTEGLEALTALSESSVELEGDLFQDGRSLLKAVNHLKNLGEKIQNLNIKNLEDISSAVENQKAVIPEIISELTAAEENLKNIKTNLLPENLREKTELLREKLKEASSLAEKIEENIPALENLLGIRYPHRYLILFQNNYEARPTGGFIGSVMLLDINDGSLAKSEIIDVYDLDGQFHEFIEPPYEIKELTNEWRLRDSNYWPDFSISGEKAAWFFQKEGGPSVDSVIAINQTILKDILEITGPVSIEELKAPITSENYDTLLSYIIESKLSGGESPKEILKKFVPAVQKEVLKKENFTKLLEIIKKEIDQKNILAYSSHEDVEKFFDHIKASGRMREPGEKEDYLSVITTSISGNKSDKYIEQTLTHSTWISREGEVINQIAVTRRHTWDKSELWEWWNILGQFGFTEISDTIKDVLGRGPNKAVIRVYVPNGSELLETTTVPDAEKTHDEKLDKEYFIFRMTVENGQEKTAVLDYKLPFKLEFSPLAAYKLHIQKQPGGVNTTLVKKITGDNLQNRKNFPENISAKENEVVYETPLLYDGYFASLWEK